MLLCMLNLKGKLLCHFIQLLYVLCIWYNLGLTITVDLFFCCCSGDCFFFNCYYDDAVAADDEIYGFVAIIHNAALETTFYGGIQITV